MPACPSSPIHPVLAHLAAAADDYQVSGTDLLTALSGVPDPRARRGVRHQMPTILAVALCAVLAGARSFTAIGEWAANASEQVLAALGTAGCPPSESCVRRALQNLDGDQLDAGSASGPAAVSAGPVCAGRSRWTARPCGERAALRELPGT
jgi:hypothetical protein